MEVLKTVNLCKSYGKHQVIDHVNMTIEKGDIYGFIGRNGAGKTSLMRMILTLSKASEGKIFLFGSEDLKENNMKVGSLIETPALHKNLTAYETIRRYSVLYGADMGKINEILKLVGLVKDAKKKVSQFSLGMKQRLGIAIALLNEPEFLVLDEPLNGLDAMGMKEIRNLIIKLNKEKNITFLISSHLLDELAKTANKIGIINDGKLIEEITMEELVAKCSRRIIFTVNDIDSATKLLADKLGNDKISSDSLKLYVNSDLDKAAELNSYLVKNEILVSGIEFESYNLEDYYMEKVGENNA